MRIRRDERGATAVEYGLIAGLIALGLLGSLVGTRGSLSSVFGTAATGLASGAPANTGTAPATPAAGSTAAGAPGVATLNYAAKGPYKAKQVFTGCNLGNCSLPNETEYRWADGSYIDIRPATSNYNGIYAFVDTSGTTTNNYYFNTNTGTGSPGDTLYISGVINGQNYSDTMTFNADGSVTGTRTTNVNGQNVQSTAPTMKRSDFQNVYDAATYARTLN